ALAQVWLRRARLGPSEFIYSPKETLRSDFFKKTAAERRYEMFFLKGFCYKPLHVLHRHLDSSQLVDQSPLLPIAAGRRSRLQGGNDLKPGHAYSFRRWADLSLWRRGFPHPTPEDPGDSRSVGRMTARVFPAY